MKFLIKLVKLPEFSKYYEASSDTISQWLFCIFSLEHVITLLISSQSFLTQLIFALIVWFTVAKPVSKYRFVGHCI